MTHHIIYSRVPILPSATKCGEEMPVKSLINVDLTQPYNVQFLRVFEVNWIELHSFSRSARYKYNLDYKPEIKQ